MTGASDVRTPWNAPFVVRDGERVEGMIGLAAIAGWVSAVVFWLKTGCVSAVVELPATDSSFRATASVSGATGRERSGRGIGSRACLTVEAESDCRVSL